MRRFGTRGRVYPDKHYVVTRTEEIADFINRIKDGRYMVLFAPRQTGKTTFFRFAVEALTIRDTSYFPIQLNFEPYRNLTSSDFYKELHNRICKEIELAGLLDNFKDFIARAGFRILQVPETPKEYVGQNLLYAYLDHFIRTIGANMFLEVQTGRGRIDLLIVHNGRKYIVETKIWERERIYQAGKKQLVAYLKSEKADEGSYVVFDHRSKPELRVETERIDNTTIRSYVIPIMEEKPSSISSF